MAKSIIGKVGMTPKGEYSSATQYKRLDVVTYEGSSYVCLEDCKGKAVSNTTYWQLMAQHGEFTEQQLEDFKAEVVADSKEEIDDYIDTKKTELNTYTGTKKTELDTYEGTKETELNTYAGGLKDDFDSNASSKTTTFNSNATTKTNNFNTNATNRTNDYNTNATTKTLEFDQNASDKTDDFNTNASAKTTDFNNNATVKTNEYNSNADEVIQANEELRAVIENELDTNEVEGTELDVSDSAEYRGPVIPGANLNQKQLSGKNRFDYITNFLPAANGLVNTLDNDGNITVTGKPIYNYTKIVDSVNIYDLLEDGETYTIVSEFDTSLITVQVAMKKSDDSGYDYIGAVKTSRSFVVDKSKYSIITIMVQTKTTADWGDEDRTFVGRAMLYKGSGDDTFEPYCGGQPSPNPDYPQEIKVVTGDNVVKHVGKNLFDSSFEEKTQYGVTITYKDGIVTINGSSNNQGFVEIRKNLLNRLGIGNHTLILQYLSGTQEGGSIRFSFGNSNMSAVADNDDRHFSIVSPGNNTLNIVQVKDFDNVRKIMRWGVWINNNITFNNYKFRLYVVKGTYTANTIPVYEPYREETFNLNLGNMELCKTGDYEDIPFKNVVEDENYNAELEEGAWYKKNVIGIISGSNQFTSNGMDDNRVGLLTPVLNIEANLVDLREKCFCNLLQTMQKNYSGLNGTTLNGKIRVYVSKEYVATYEEAKQLLEDIIIYFVQLNPTYTKITDPTLISQLEALSKAKWFKGVNHWWTETDNLEPVLKGTYKQSNNLRIKEQDERLTNLESRLALLE